MLKTLSYVVVFSIIKGLYLDEREKNEDWEEYKEGKP